MNQEMQLYDIPVVDLVFALGMHGSMRLGDIERLLGDKAPGTVYEALRAGIITQRASGHVSLNPITRGFSLDKWLDRFYVRVHHAEDAS